MGNLSILLSLVACENIGDLAEMLFDERTELAPKFLAEEVQDRPVDRRQSILRLGDSFFFHATRPLLLP